MSSLLFDAASASTLFNSVATETEFVNTILKYSTGVTSSYCAVLTKLLRSVCPAIRADCHLIQRWEYFNMVSYRRVRGRLVKALPSPIVGLMRLCLGSTMTSSDLPPDLHSNHIKAYAQELNLSTRAIARAVIRYICVAYALVCFNMVSVCRISPSCPVVHTRWSDSPYWNTLLHRPTKNWAGTSLYALRLSALSRALQSISI